VPEKINEFSFYTATRRKQAEVLYIKQCEIIDYLEKIKL